MREAVLMSLMIGPAVPIPVPRSVLDALVSVKVVTDAGETASGFELAFSMDRNSPLPTLFMLAGGGIAPIIRVIVVATVNGTSEVLIDGVVTNTRVTDADGKPVLTVLGKDLTALMDYIDLSGIPYPCMPPEARILTIIARYAMFGMIPLIIPSVLLDIPIPTERIPRQQGTDLAYIRSLADEVGYVFYLKPGPAAGVSVAYWGPEIKVGAPQPAITLDMEHFRNAGQISFNFDAEKAELPLVMIQEPVSKVPILIPIPDISPLNPPLGLIPAFPKKFPIIDETAKYSPIRAALVGLAKAAKRADAVTAEGSLDLVRYGQLLHARELVGVRGAGFAFDGLYYVSRVTHEIARGQYKQSFTLKRNALVSNVSQVAV